MCDSIEIIETIEESFGIKFSDEELERVYTVKDLSDCIISKIGPEKHGVCISSVVFFTLRKILVEEFEIARGLIKPDTNLNVIISKEKRRKAFSILGEKTGYQLPCMGFTPIIKVLFISSFMIVLSSLFLIWVFPKLIFLSVIAFAFIFFAIKTEVLEVRFPGVNIKDYINMVVAQNFQKLSAENDSLRYNDVINAIKTIIGDHVGINSDQIQLEDRLVKDLGID